MINIIYKYTTLIEIEIIVKYNEVLIKFEMILCTHQMFLW